MTRKHAPGDFITPLLSMRPVTLWNQPYESTAENLQEVVTLHLNAMVFVVGRMRSHLLILCDDRVGWSYYGNFEVVK